MSEPADGSSPPSGLRLDPNFIIAHQVECSGLLPAHSRHPESAIFLDHPRLFKGDTKADALHGRRAVKSMPRYLSRNPGAGFIVYRTYSCTDYHQHLFDTLQDTSGHYIQSDLFVLDQDAAPAFPEREHMDIVSDELCHVIDDVCSTRKVDAPWQDHDMFARRQSGWDSEHNMLAPYLYLHHTRELLRKVPSNSQYREHIDLLLGYIDDSFGHEYRQAEELFGEGYVTRGHIHKLFSPNQILVIQQGEHIATVMTKNCPRPHSFPIRIDCERWSFDGRFARSNERIVIHWPSDERQQWYGSHQIDDGRVAISSLAAYPLEWASLEIQDLVLRRGKIFWQCRDVRFVSYEADIQTSLTQVNGRYMIDMRTYQELHGKQDIAATEMDSTKEYLDPDMVHSVYGSLKDFLLLLPPTIVGFSFHDKRWRTLAVENIRGVKWSKGDFEQLILDVSVKEVLSALLRQQLGTRREAKATVDNSRGMGLIVLLHGGPGTGKTRTAEAVAELLEAPLYRITSGDIGLAAEEVDRNLELVFRLANAWNAVVLFDNCEAFLEQRGSENMQHGAAFSIIIRALESYKGTLILTTNRVLTRLTFPPCIFKVDSIDRALKSRVRFAIHLPNPSEAERLVLWQNAISELRVEDRHYIELDSWDMRGLAAVQVNGNEIQNAIRTARQLAADRREPMTLEHIRQTLNIMFNSTPSAGLFEAAS